MKKLFSLLLLIISLASSGQTLTKKWAVPGGSVNVIIQYPAGAGTAVLPAVIAFPGKGEFGSNAAMLYSNTPLSFAKTNTFTPNMIIVAVQVPDACCPGTWQLAATILDSLSKGPYHIDWNKWYMTGLSYGAATIMNYIQQTPDANFRKPAAVAIMSINMMPLCGSKYSGTLSLCGNDMRFASIPNWCFCGTADAFYEDQTKYVALETGAKYPVKYTTSGIGHGPWTQWLDPKFGLYDWFLTNSNGPATVPNKPPVANAGAPQTITLPVDSAKLDCSGSYDPDGTLTVCSFSLISGPNHPIWGRNSVSGLVDGIYTFLLTIKDDKGATSTATTTITVLPALKVVLFSIKLADGKTFTLYTDGSYTLL